MNYYRRLFVKGASWTNGYQKVTIHMDDNRLTIRLYPESRKQGNYYLYVTFRKSWENGWEARIDDLNCHSIFDQPWQRGAGRLLVNLASQCMRLRFADVQEPVTVCGEAVPNAAHSSQESSENRRRNYAFWQRTGFQIEDPDAARSLMNCALDKFLWTGGGTTIGGIPLALSIKGFVVQANEHFCIAGDEERILSIQGAEKALTLPPAHQLGVLKKQAATQHLKSIVLLSSILPLLLGALSKSYVLAGVGGALALFFGIVAVRKGFLLDSVSASRELQQQQLLKDGIVDGFRRHLTLLTEKEPTVLSRMMVWHQLPMAQLRHQHIQAIEYLESRQTLSDDHVVALIQCVAHLQQRFSSKAERDDAETPKDFLFGEHCDSFDDHSLSNWASILGDQYGAQLERLLSSVGTLRISGTTDTRFDGILAGISDHVAYIEFYREGKKGFADLSARVYMRNGLLSLSGVWSAYKDSRAGEIAKMLQSLMPLDLLKKVYIRWDGKTLTQIAQSGEEAVSDILVLLDQPHYSQADIRRWLRGGIAAVD